MTTVIPNRFVHLGLNPKGRLPEDVPSKIEGYLDRVADDWYRYAAQNYVLWTNKNLTELTRELAQLPDLKTYYFLATEFVSAVPPVCDGWMAPRFWEWLHKSRS